MSDHIEHACPHCGSYIHRADQCPNKSGSTYADWIEIMSERAKERRDREIESLYQELEFSRPASIEDEIEDAKEAGSETEAKRLRSMCECHCKGCGCHRSER